MENKTTVKKAGPIKRIKNWWHNLTESEQLAVICGVWFVDGLLIGSGISDIKRKKIVEQAEQQGAVKGYALGQIDAYKEMAQNPYQMMNAGMSKLEQQGKAKHF